MTTAGSSANIYPPNREACMNSASDWQAARDGILAAVAARDWPALPRLSTPEVAVTLPDGRIAHGVSAVTDELRGHPMTLGALGADEVTQLGDTVRIVRGRVRATAELP